MNPIHRIAITAGEPAGIGPDLVVELAQQPHTAELVVIADPELLHARAETLGIALETETFDNSKPATSQRPGVIKVIPVKLNRPVLAGQLNRENSSYVLDTLRQATHACLNNTLDALVTAPVHKGVINEAGIKFSGHTEYLAELTNTKQVVMMLATEGLRVALATTHLPLRDICETITPVLLQDVIRILHDDLQTKFGIDHPNIYVCGLNPHAGEDGHLGLEDETIVKPTLEKMRQEHIRLIGPLPADTLFIPKHLDHAHAVLAMYHDQGLPVLKHMGFGKAVNITLGLPIIRTSVDHGTALELAGTGKANMGSLEYAIETAIRMARQWKQTQ